jgi:hypothetical protein
MIYRCQSRRQQFIDTIILTGEQFFQVSLKQASGAMSFPLAVASRL